MDGRAYRRGRDSGLGGRGRGWGMGRGQAIEKLENRDKYSQQGDACLTEARAFLARSELDKVRPLPTHARPPRRRRLYLPARVRRKRAARAA